jgi:hypothetical protein
MEPPLAAHVFAAAGSFQVAHVSATSKPTCTAPFVAFHEIADRVRAAIDDEQSDHRIHMVDLHLPDAVLEET